MGQNVSCPQCNYRLHYRLADGRRKCRRCGKRFVSIIKSRPPGRLSQDTLLEIARLFWLHVPAGRAATVMSLSTKTMERRYRQLRRGLALRRPPLVAAPLDGEVEVDESYFGGHRKGRRGRGAGGKRVVFGLLKRGGEVRVVLPQSIDKRTLQGHIMENVRPHSWVYSDGFSSYNDLDISGFRHVRIDHSQTFGAGRSHINGIENFWNYAKRRLAVYHGGYRRHFEDFLHEVEFLFNNRNDPDGAIKTLYEILTTQPVGQ